MLLNQFSILAENIQKTLPPGHEGSQRIADQIQCLKTKRERWPGKIISVWKTRVLPVFSAEPITKLNEAHMSMVDEVNDSRKRQKESLRADINRKKKQLDDVEAKREKIVDSYDSVNLTCRRELTLHQPNSFKYARIRSAYESCQNSIQRLAASERQLRQNLALIVIWDGYHILIHIS